MVRMQFGVNKHSEVFDAVSACSREFTQFVIEAELSKGTKYSPRKAKLTAN
jgi:hypothetical protein